MKSTLSYRELPEALQKQIERDRAAGWVSPYRFDDRCAVRRDMQRDIPNLWRPVFVRDTEKILHLPVYNRYADKTQVFSFYHNDDITRRALHVQLVSRIARNIGTVLGLNLDLIEAIALGHDIGHTPFGHAGERFLSQCRRESCGRYFNHNVQSVRVLDTMFRRNVTLQTLDGILCHNGEMEQAEYRPCSGTSFERLDRQVKDCTDQGGPAIAALVPSTLEGCVVRICDIIAYLGKDRQDAVTARIIMDDGAFSSGGIGAHNADMINNLIVDILENSYGRDCIVLSRDSFEDLKRAKRENSELIYQNKSINEEYESTVRPMFSMMYGRLLEDVRSGREDTEAYRHHIAFVNRCRRYYTDDDYADSDADDIVTDYIAGMTDDYFLALFKRLFPDSPLEIHYRSYFEENET